MPHHPFLFGEISTQSQATSKEFLAPLPGRKQSLLRAYRRRRGDSITFARFLITNLISLQLHYLPFASRFPLPHFTQFVILFALFFVCLFLVRSLFACNLVCIVTTTQENTKLCDFSNTNNNDFISTPIAPPTTSAESCDINAALLNLVMKDQFAGTPNEDAASHLNMFVLEYYIYSHVTFSYLPHCIRGFLDIFHTCTCIYIGL